MSSWLNTWLVSSPASLCVCAAYACGSLKQMHTGAKWQSKHIDRTLQRKNNLNKMGLFDYFKSVCLLDVWLKIWCKAFVWTTNAQYRIVKRQCYINYFITAAGRSNPVIELSHECETVACHRQLVNPMPAAKQSSVTLPCEWLVVAMTIVPAKILPKPQAS